MIIYKLEETGQATKFQFSQKCPDGWQSIPGDRIPEDLTPYHEQRYLDSEAVKEQERDCLRLLAESDKTMCDDWPYPDDKPKWESYRAELRSIVKAKTIMKIPAKPF